MRITFTATICLCAGVGAFAAEAEESPKVLNNLVSELLHVDSPAADANSVYELNNPRAGWIFVASTARVRDGSVTITLESGDDSSTIQVHKPGTTETHEAMRYLGAGRHRLRVAQQLGARLKELTVRAIPELAYSKYGADPQVTEFGRFDLAYLNRYVLGNLNCMIGPEGKPDAAFIEQWKRDGKRYLIEVRATPYFEKMPADRALGYWTSVPGLAHPDVDGLIADEFSRSDDASFDAITESVRLLRSNERFRNKRFIPYCASMFGGKTSEAFAGAVIDNGWNIAWERYLPEMANRDGAEQYLQRVLVDEAKQWQKHIPGSVEHLTVCFGHLISAPPESVNTSPAVDHKYYMDMQFNILANAPEFKGLGGVMEYLSRYTDEEYLRWAMRLYRHYAIEGNRGLLSEKYGYTYAPGHLVDPDFEKGLDGWDLQPAAPDTISAGRHPGYGWLQGRYPRTGSGDNFLLTTRSAKKPNVFSQQVQRLKPGLRYSVKLYTGDYDDLEAGRSRREKHAVSIRVEPSDAVESRSFQHVFAHCYSHDLGPFNRDHRYWMNYYQKVFRARQETATLTVSDWADAARPGGPVGQRLMFNFVELQPYFEE